MRGISGEGREFDAMLRVLLITNRFPTERAPHSGTFVPGLMKALTGVGLSVDALRIDRHALGRMAYWAAPKQIRRAVVSFDPDVVHVLWGGVLSLITASLVRDRSVVVSLCGCDMLGM